MLIIILFTLLFFLSFLCISYDIGYSIVKRKENGITIQCNKVTNKVQSAISNIKRYINTITIEQYELHKTAVQLKALGRDLGKINPQDPETTYNIVKYTQIILNEINYQLEEGSSDTELSELEHICDQYINTGDIKFANQLRNAHETLYKWALIFERLIQNKLKNTEKILYKKDLKTLTKFQEFCLTEDYNDTSRLSAYKEAWAKLLSIECIYFLIICLIVLIMQYIAPFCLKYQAETPSLSYASSNVFYIYGTIEHLIHPAVQWDPQHILSIICFVIECALLLYPIKVALCAIRKAIELMANGYRLINYIIWSEPFDQQYMLKQWKQLVSLQLGDLFRIWPTKRTDY